MYLLIFLLKLENNLKNQLEKKNLNVECYTEKKLDVKTFINPHSEVFHSIQTWNLTRTI